MRSRHARSAPRAGRESPGTASCEHPGDLEDLRRAVGPAVLPEERLPRADLDHRTLEEERQRHALAEEEVDRRLLRTPQRQHALPPRVQVGVVDRRVPLDRRAREALDLHRGGVGDRERDLRVRLDVLELLREEDARREVDQLTVVERDQRVRDGTAGGIDDGQLADERRRKQRFDRLGKDAHARKITSAATLDDDVRQRLELRSVAALFEVGARLRGVLERDLSRALECTRRSDADECAVQRPTRERGPHDLVLAGREQQRQGRRAFSEVVSGDLARLDRRARAVEDVVGDLERDPEGPSEVAETGIAAAEQTRGAEERQRRVGQQLHVFGVARRRELREGSREQVIARRASADGAMGAPGGRVSAAQSGAVDQVVVDEAGHVHQLDRDAGGEWRLTRRSEEDEERAQPLAAGGESRSARLGGRPGMARNGGLQALFERGEVVVEPRHLDGGEGAHAASPTSRTTMPPPSSLVSTVANPAARTSARSSSGTGKRRTLAGRYVNAAPPGSALPARGITRSN